MKRIFFILLLTSCNAQNSYLKKIEKNVHEVTSILNYIHDNKLFEKKDSLNKTKNAVYIKNKVCLYKEDIKDTLIQNYMKKYNFDRICLEERNDNYFKTVIIFHKSYNPILGKSIVIQYDFGESPLRTRIRDGVKKENTYYSTIIDSLYIYSENKKPAFGE
ncbi:hypothetical protein GCM10010992_26000 [Cloacibacterium rupense]|uniref:Lipoprotein n=1 Tax=Cloacibacterium rupense TaxID=517423 RepID=A0ABQ2NMW1_9FLAO|nr:hypothetical protein [Cloacibacterium rupense]GGP06308.1 hypothetical protein GCM10010992_26000 [Cloacibacterium rupense]